MQDKSLDWPTAATKAPKATTIPYAHIERSKKWFTLDHAQVNKKGEIVWKLTSIVGQKKKEGRAARIARIYNLEVLGGELGREWFYQIT